MTIAEELSAQAVPPACRAAVFVVSETRLYREGITVAVREHFDVVGTAAGLDAAIAAIERLPAPPDVALLDHGIPEGAGAVIRLRRAIPGLRILALAVREAEGDVIPWAEAGAAGFLPHEASLSDLVAGVTAIASGCGMCSPAIAAVLLDRVASLAAGLPAPHAGLAELTQREHEVATLLAEGLSNKEIAIALTIEVATVKNHVHNVLEKLHVRRRGEAATMLRSAERSGSRARAI